MQPGAAKNRPSVGDWRGNSPLAKAQRPAVVLKRVLEYFEFGGRAGDRREHLCELLLLTG